MKINIIEEKNALDTEITIKCTHIDTEIENLLAALRLIDCVIVGKIEDESFFIPANEIYYFETVDNKTFFYTKDKILETTLKIYQIEDKLLGSSFVRANRSTIINLKKVKSIKSSLNSRIIACLINNENIIISRQYMKDIKTKLGM